MVTIMRYGCLLALGILIAFPVQAEVLNFGDILVADIDANAVIRIDPVTGTQTMISNEGLIERPIDLAIDSDGQILVLNCCDNLSNGIVRVDPMTGGQSQVTGPLGFESPGGITLKISPDGSRDILVVYEFGIGRVDLSTGAQTVVSAGGLFADAVGNGITVDANGDIIVDNLNISTEQSEIIRVDPLKEDPLTISQQTLVSSGGLLERSVGISLDNNGDILVANATGGKIVRVNPLTGAQMPVTLGGELVRPFDLVVDTTGDIFVSDGFFGEDTGQIIKVNSSTGEQTVVSTGGMLNRPSGIDIFNVQTVQTVGIDIRPKKKKNKINLRFGRFVRVAILSSSAANGDELDFDALQVDPATVRFGPGGAKVVGKKVKDVDRDGDLDLILRFRIRKTGISCGDTTADITGQTFTGQAITGTDTIKTKGCRW